MLVSLHQLHLMVSFITHRRTAHHDISPSALSVDWSNWAAMCSGKNRGRTERTIITLASDQCRELIDIPRLSDL